MRREFAHYYPPTPAQFEGLWSSGTIVLDTNVLLNLYRYTDASRADFEAALRNFAERLWIPHQVALEFHKNRLKVIDEQVQAFDSVAKKLTDAHAIFEGDMGPFRKNESLNVEALISKHRTMTEDLMGMVAAAKEAHRRVPQNPDEDPTGALLSALFEDRVGEPFQADRLKAVHEMGAERYAAKTPPGYRDADKAGLEQYGDLILWMQILEHAKQSKQDVLFITDDSKEDWWRRERGKTIGPRPELIKEFFEQTGQQVHFYAPKQFLDRASNTFDVKISQATYDEVEKLSERQKIDGRDEVVDTRTKAQRLRAVIREMNARLALLDSPRMKAVPSAMRMASIQEELHRLERKKARILEAIGESDDEEEWSAATDSLLSTQEEIDRVAQAWEDEQEDRESIADMHNDKDRLTSQLAMLTKQYNELPSEYRR